MLAVKIAVEIEQMRFHQRHLGLVHRPDAEIGDAVMAAHLLVIVHDGDAHRIDAKGRRQAVAQMHVGGGKAHGAAAPVAMLDPRFHRPPAAQQPRGFFAAWPPSAAARMRVEEIFCVARRRHHVETGDGKAFRLAHLGKVGRLPPRPLPNSKSGPTTTPLTPRPVDQHIPHEIRRRCASPCRHRRAARTAHPRPARPAAAPSCAAASGGWNPARPEKFLRMRLESQHRQRARRALRPARASAISA